MLTGMYTPTSGTAKIAGLDVHDQIDQIRRLLGFCPQHNVLWDDLTCSEHIHFFSTLKGWVVQDISNDSNNTRLLELSVINPERTKIF